MGKRRYNKLAQIIRVNLLNPPNSRSILRLQKNCADAETDCRNEKWQRCSPLSQCNPVMVKGWEEIV